ncbi:MAG: chromosomal replication initiator protein DnaA, partial [Desulfobulbaceae bacterium]|nr:chromosomal replication initiator protein DnaA [Desulfobulbaceae bacterium]
MWIEPIHGIQSEDALLELICPDQFFASWVTEHYLPLIKEGLAVCGHGGMNVRCVMRPGNSQAGALIAHDVSEQLRLPCVPEQQQGTIRTLHPRYTFDEFMVGDSNALAHSACSALAGGDT